MTDWPSGISTFRTHENLPQQVYDPLDLKTFFAEDLQRIEAQLVAVENTIGVGLEKIYPVGSLYFNADVTTNPATLLGFGTWAVFGEGLVIVGKQTTGTFQTLADVIGEEEVTLTEEQSGLVSHNHDQDSHNHTQDSHNHTQNSHSHTITSFGSGAGGGGQPLTSNNTGGSSTPSTSSTTATNQATTATNQATTATNQAVTGADASSPHNNIQPSIVVCMWKRTA
jgi:microcystin-dependent protein